MAKSGYVKFFDAVSFKPIENLTKIRDFYTYSQNQGKPLRIRVAATHSGKITRNNGFYLPHKMRAGAKTFINQYRKPIQVHHGDEIDPIGRVVESNYIDLSGTFKDSFHDSFEKSIKDMDRFLKGKMSFKDSVEWANVYFINDKVISEDPDYQGLGYIELVADITDSDAIHKVLDGRYLTGSVGATTDAAVCSVCKQDWANEGKCDHSPGKIYDNSKCVLVAGDLIYDEWSFVNKPADSHSSVIEVNIDGVKDFVKVDKNKNRIPEITLVVDQDKIILTTGPATDDGHVHELSLNDIGNGTTSKSHGHQHDVVNYIVKEFNGHTHEIPESDEIMRLMRSPTQHQNLAQEEKIMTFRDAMKLVSKLDFFKDLDGLQDAIKSVLNNEKQDLNKENLPRLVADQLGKIDDYDIFYNPENKLKNNLEIENNSYSNIKDFYGQEYEELIGDDPWGKDYLEMLYDYYNDAAEQDKENVKNWIKDAKLTANQRKNLSSSTFCGPNRSYPVTDCGHAKAAMARAKQFNAGSAVISCVTRKAKRLGCSFDGNNSDSVKKSEYSNIEYYDKFTDDQLQDMSDGLKSALLDRGLECTECLEAANKALELNEALNIANGKIKEMESISYKDSNKEIESLKNKLETAYKEIKYLHQDIDNLQNNIADTYLDIRHHMVSRIVDMKKLAGEEVDDSKLVKELSEKTTSDLNLTIKDYVQKVDLNEIADNLKSGLANHPEGKISDPTLMSKSGTENKLELSKTDLQLVQDNYLRLRFDPNQGQLKATQYLEDLKRRGVIPSECPIKE